MPALKTGWQARLTLKGVGLMLRALSLSEERLKEYQKYLTLQSRLKKVKYKGPFNGKPNHDFKS